MYFSSLHFTRQKPRRKVPPPLSMDSYSESPTYPYSSSVQYSVDTGQLLDQNFALMLGLFHRWVFKTFLRCWNYKSVSWKLHPRIKSLTFTSVILFQGVSGFLFAFLPYIDSVDLFIGISYLLRFIEGLGTAMAWSSALGILMEIFPNKVRRHKLGL